MRATYKVDKKTTSLLVQLQRPDGTWVDVGILLHDGSANWFEFLPDYWDLGARPVLGQIFEERGRTWKPRAHVALPRWFSHLLPEGRMRTAVASAAHVHAAREFELIRRLGATDLPGAVRAVKGTDAPQERVAPRLFNEDDADPDDPLLKFSLAGAQLKYSLLADRRGLTIPAHGLAGNVIAKLPDGRPGFEGVPEAEYAALELARAASICTASARLATIAEISGLEDWVVAGGSSSVLIVDRFDRLDDGSRIHIEELAQVMDIPTAREHAKYRSANFETVANYIAALSGVNQVADVIDRIVLNVLVGNGDAHLKNWAFRYIDGQNPTLSPLYDVVPTVLYMAGDNLGLNLNGSKEFEAVEIASFDEIGRRTGFGVAEARQQAKSAVERVRASWSMLDDLLPSSQFKALTTRLASLPLAH